MSSYEFKLPDIGEGIAEAEIVAWHARIGDRIEEDAPIADLMTDKATVEITSPVSGTISSLVGDVGEMIAIGSVFVVIETNQSALAESEPEPAPAEEPAPSVAAAPVVPANDAAPARRILTTPAIRQRAATLGIDLTQVRVPAGERIRHADLDAYLTYDPTYRRGGKPRPDEQVRVIGLRRRIAENMAASKRNIPHFSYIEEINVTKLEALRADLNATRGDRPRLTILPLLMLAICRALPDFPMINALYDDQAGIVTRSGAVHLGMATQTDAGLLVPVIRDAHDKNLWQLAAEIARLSDAARSGKASSAELSGSTLTVTSQGPLGGIATTPVINRPEVAIIGPNRVVERPIVVDGEIVIASLMNMSISCDHRVVDGWDAARFVQRVKTLLETPAQLFVD